jgi:soluble lytic murein transglycosylase-like protein
MYRAYITPAGRLVYRLDSESYRAAKLAQAAKLGTPYRPVPDEQTIHRFADRVAEATGLDPKVFRRLVEALSGFMPDVVSPDGRAGIAQLYPALVPGVNLYDPEAALTALAARLAFWVARTGSFTIGAAKALGYSPSAPDPEFMAIVNYALGV